MAVLLQGMTHREASDLAIAMARSGDTLDLHQIAPFVVDKHSTGGVGDKTTLVVAPLVASQGLPVGKMSGRGLDFSGGTLDKLESIPGLTVCATASMNKISAWVITMQASGLCGAVLPARGIVVKRRLFPTRALLMRASIMLSMQMSGDLTPQIESCQSSLPANHLTASLLLM